MKFIFIQTLLLSIVMGLNQSYPESFEQIEALAEKNSVVGDSVNEMESNELFTMEPQKYEQIKDTNYDKEVKINPEKVIVGYYADWKARDLPPESIPFDKITHINYSFAIVKESTLEPYFETDYLLPRVIKAAHKNNVKVLLSVGGWTGSKFFSDISADADKRKKFIDKLVEYVKQFELDGIDIDWEFPGRLGMSCNKINPQSDAVNFVTLLRELRGNFDGIFKNEHKLITLAVRVEPIDGPSGPLGDTTDLANAVDFINVMAYDINGPWSSTTGPNAPLRHQTGKGFQLSYMSGVTSWLGSKFPKDKLVMGLAFYGRSFLLENDIKLNTKDKNAFYVPFSKTIPQGDDQDAMWSDPCPGAPYTYSGVWQWKNLRSQGVLKDALTSDTAGGWERYFDEVALTPWLYNKSKKMLITYDDTESLAHKVEYAKCMGLRGVMIWALHEDNMELLNSIQPMRTTTPASKCSMYSKLDESQNKLAGNRSMIINKSPYAQGTYGLMVGINRHAGTQSSKTIPLPDKVFSS